VNLEGTWRPPGGHLVGRGESQEIFVGCGFAGEMASTWRVFGKSIYMVKPVTSERVASYELKKPNKKSKLQKIILLMIPSFPLTAAGCISIEVIDE